jgi:hypothetical protein
MPFQYWVADSYPSSYPDGNFTGRAGASEVNTLGFRFASGFVTPIDEVMDSVYRLKFTFSHSDPTLVLNFAASGLQQLTDESWGLANVSVVTQ